MRNLAFGVFVGGMLLMVGNGTASSLTYQSSTNVGFTFNPAISISLSDDLLISSLSPGSTSDSNIIDVAINTNASQGYTLTATAGTSSTTTNLVNTGNNNNIFTSLATNATITDWTNANDNTWGYSYSEDNGTTWISGKDGSNQNILGYSGLPLDNDDSGATGKTLISTTLPSDNKTLKFKIGAKASSSQASGDYTNIINFYAVANPEPSLTPVSCPAGKICYNANSLTTVEGEMGQQTASNNQEVTLYASNFSRANYGFAGWSDSYTGNGNKYGPNQTITAPSDISTTGLSLYAIWVPSAGNMQSWTGCNNLAQGEVTALTDTRDNNVYAVAKLADDKCWMIENLRLENTGAHNTDGTLAQGYNSSFIGLADPESANFDSSITAANSLYSTGSSTTATISGRYQGYRFPRYNNNNTNSRQSSSGYVANRNTYSMGNYYTWHAAIADTTHYSSGNHNTTSICPAGWHLPTGVATTGEFALLDIALGGTGSSTDSSIGSTGAVMSSRYRSYPNNFLYSSSFSGSSADSRGSHGLYWSSTAHNDFFSYYLRLDSSNVYPGTLNYYKYYGFAIRCTLGS